MIEATRLKKLDLAYQLFEYGINIDMGQNMHSSDAGIHAGSLAAIYQMILFGFGGLDWHNDELHLNPILPKHWKKLTYRFQYKNSQFKVVIKQDHFLIKTINNSHAQELIISDQKHLIDNELKRFEIKYDLRNLSLI